MDPGVPSRASTILSICTSGSRCGCALYQESVVKLVADKRDPGDPYKGLDLLIQRVDPCVVIVSTAQRQLISFLDKRFEFKLWDISSKMKIQEDVIDPAFILAVVPNIWFSISSGERRLIESEWVKSQGLTDEEQKQFFVRSRINKSVDVCAVRAISAIDKYLILEFSNTSTEEQALSSMFSASYQKESMTQDLFLNSQATQRSNYQARVHENNMPIVDVGYTDPGPVLSVDKFTCKTLGIFPESISSQQTPTTIIDAEIQPIPSLFEVLNQCQSIQGKKTLRTMMMWPLQELDEIRHRHELIDYFIRPENKIFRDQLIIQLKGIVPLSGILAKLNDSIGNYKELSIVYRSLWAFLALIDLIKSNGCVELELLNRIVVLESPELRATVDSIMSIIDFEASKKEKRLQVCLGVDQNVDEKREIVKNLMKFCDEVSIQETARYKDLLGKSCHVFYIPRIGFLNSINYTSSTELTQVYMNREFEVLLHTEDSVYFKTRRMEELDHNAGDVACDLIDVQESVVVNLQSEILQHSPTILRLMELCGELDCVLSFALVSLERGYTRPEFVSSMDEMDIRQAYHPNHSLKCNIVPNDVTFFSQQFQRRAKVMVITGPNSCGKTTYMKAACLVVYMAHIGCFVPAMNAKIPVVDAILTRMQSANSISTGLSSFATDLHQINYALNRATDRSLIAIDEFGKGTLARDGFHLLKGLVAYFATRGHQSPYVMVATHFNRLIDHLQSYSEHILYKTFQISRDTMRDTITYEYRLKDGVSESSLADQVALRAGIPQSMIARANQIKDYITEGRPIQSRPPNAALNHEFG